MSAPYDGGCSCGGVRYRVADEPLLLHACHCRDCQRQTGSAFLLTLTVMRSSLEILDGQPREFVAAMADGREKRARFCGECSTLLWGDIAKFPEAAVVMAGTLDDTTWLDPVAHIWTGSSQPWVSIPERALNFEQQPCPEDWVALMERWRAR